VHRTAYAIVPGLRLHGSFIGMVLRLLNAN
jgi:hypothetical protein